MLHRRSILATLAGLTLAGVARAQSPVNTDKAQPTLPTEKMVIVTQDGRRLDFTVEMATTEAHQIVGLMFRTAVAPDSGMLFDWGRDRDSSMWMRNTLVSLDMLFIKADGTVHHIAEHTVPRSLAVIPSDGQVRATLEVAAGTVDRLNIRVGDKVQQRIFGNAP